LAESEWSWEMFLLKQIRANTEINLKFQNGFWKMTLLFIRGI